MKNNSEVSMWSLMRLISLLGMLGLLVSVSVFAETVNISIKPDNAMQHIDYVRIIQVGNSDAEATISSVGAGLLNIQTNSNILLGENNQIGTTIGSAILGGINNRIIGSQYSTIIAGAGNGISGIGNTILGGQLNKIRSSQYSTIAGGLNNAVAGQYSTIVGGKDNSITGDYSVIVGSKNAVSGNNSVAIGKNSVVNANNSFLWKDSTQDGQLNANDVFAVVSRKGMVINSSHPNEYAQLTIGGPLVISVNSSKDQNVVCGFGQGGGTMKTIDAGGRYCLCSCDGSSRNSMFGQGQCQSICHGDDVHPVCGTDVRKVQSGSIYTFRGSCASGYLAEGTGAYLVDSKNVVHWRCLISDGSGVNCTGVVAGITEASAGCNPLWAGGTIVPDGSGVLAYLPDNPTCSAMWRVCRNGVFDGNSEYNSPSCNRGCKIPWSNEYISDGSSLTAYEHNVVSDVSLCVSQQRTCNNGVLSGTWTYKNCTGENSQNNCYYNGDVYTNGQEIVTYPKSSYQCPDGCSNHVFTGKCDNGHWVDALGQTVVLKHFTTCDSTDSSNATTYILSSCPGNGTCGSETVYLGGSNTGCNALTMYKLGSCDAGYYNSGDVSCEKCATGYTSEAGSYLRGCMITCGDKQYLSDPGATACTSCPNGTYMTGHKVSYGSTSTCMPCDNKPDNSDYISSATGNNCEWECKDGYDRIGNRCVLP